MGPAVKTEFEGCVLQAVPLCVPVPVQVPDTANVHPLYGAVVHVDDLLYLAVAPSPRLPAALERALQRTALQHDQLDQQACARDSPIHHPKLHLGGHPSLSVAHLGRELHDLVLGPADLEEQHAPICG
eukprot:CAMPEP_0173201434 /NCGR_PEP_ID=MMETSP1141-20130122/18349_1 /TAXON_ID=483371 /ORGANISM="non described non described, Strain CCMP2298" /LENGTH=127 /DNA_ID=CAMNT_0014126555 /DNA_START=115 /DNA_END=498 /DNA_ORIENTATION=+